MSDLNNSQTASKDSAGTGQDDRENVQTGEADGAADNKPQDDNTPVVADIDNKMQKLGVKANYTKENDLEIDLSDNDKGDVEGTKEKPLGNTTEEPEQTQPHVMDSNWGSNDNMNNQRDTSVGLQQPGASGDDALKAGGEADQQTSRLDSKQSERSAEKPDERYQNAEADTRSGLTEEEQRKAALEKSRKFKTHDDDDYDANRGSKGKHRGGFNHGQSGETDAQRRFKDAEKNYTYFWKSEDVFSQWHESKFYNVNGEKKKKVNGIKFTCAEQYMMYQKAKLFGSDDIAKEILKTKSPRKMKSLGRQVKQFRDNTWCWHCLEVVKDASIFKYTQNKGMKEILFSTYPTVLVEASPYDHIWGIGLVKQDERAWQEETWDGLNLLGYILTEVRDELMFNEGIIPEKECKTYLWELQVNLFKQNLENDPGTSVDRDWSPDGDWEDWKTLEYQYTPGQAGN